ncbi:MAG TPA: RDD family protein [Verrucomicrobiae bacterium]|nr:RDD family protein [Verrucomicrobiae bacterium]
MKIKTFAFISFALLTLSTLPLVAQEDSLESPQVLAPEIATNSAAEAESESSETAATPNLRRGPVLAFGKTAELAADQTAEAVIAIAGTARAHGRVREAVVAIMGDAEANNRVGDSVVAIAGNVRVNGETREAVAVLGSVMVGSNAVIRGDVVSIGGTVKLAEGARVHGQIHEMTFDVPGLPRIEELSLWVRECVFKLRPLAPQVRWVWIVVGAFIGLYFLIAVLFPGPIELCRAEIAQRPATTFVVGLFSKIAIPIILLVLAATGIGLLVVPFVFAAGVFAALVGKVALLQFVGGALTRAFGLQGRAAELLSLAIGSIIMIVLYMIPVVGFLAFAVFGVWALGAVVTAAFTRITRERPPRPPRGNPPTFGGGGSANPQVDPAAPHPAGSGTGFAPTSGLVAYPRAGFWERMGSGFVDLALLSIPFAILGPLGLLVLLAYFAGMWTWKGTTIGGLVLQQQVVRYDGKPLNFTVALVRGLAACFSACMLFIGFFWIGWNREKQAWHDLIAGTYVVRLPRAMPLVCL